MDLPPMAALFFRIKNRRTPPGQLPEEAVSVPLQSAETEKSAETPEVTETAAPRAEEATGAPEKPVASGASNATEKPPEKPEAKAKAPEKPTAGTPVKAEAKSAVNGDKSKEITAHKVGTGGNI